MEEHVVRVGAGGEILFGGEPCDAASVDTTEEIRITGTDKDDDVVIDLRGGLFEPGATEEETGISEIEFSLDLQGTSRFGFGDVFVLLGTREADRVVLGREGIALNDDDDADVVMANGASTVPIIVTLRGDDVVTGRGGSGTGAALRQVLLVGAGAGADRLLGGDRANWFFGGGGDDTLVGGPKRGELVGGGGRDRVHGGGARDFLLGGGANDRLVGGSESDFIAGGRGRDLLEGGPGNDYLDGGRGVDTCRPGPGRDRRISCEH